MAVTVVVVEKCTSIWPFGDGYLWIVYRGANKGVHVLLSRTQAGPGITVKQEQEEISRNHVQTFICLSVVSSTVPIANYGPWF